jgi:hypothetical protein
MRDLDIALSQADTSMILQRKLSLAVIKITGYP